MIQHPTTMENLKPGQWFLRVDADGVPTDKKPTGVQNIDVRPAGCPNHVHVNGNQCYDATLPVLALTNAPMKGH